LEGIFNDCEINYAHVEEGISEVEGGKRYVGYDDKNV